MTKTYDVLGGLPVPDLTGMSAAEVLERKRRVERMLAETRDNPARAQERAQLRAENDRLSARLGELREAERALNQRRNFAGIGLPFYEAAAARLDAVTLAAIEADAMARFAERERISAERKAAKAKKP
jgi:hypothetical protein